MGDQIEIEMWTARLCENSTVYTGLFTNYQKPRVDNTGERMHF